MSLFLVSSSRGTPELPPGVCWGGRGDIFASPLISSMTSGQSRDAAKQRNEWIRLLWLLARIANKYNRNKVKMKQEGKKPQLVMGFSVDSQAQDLSAFIARRSQPRGPPLFADGHLEHRVHGPKREPETLQTRSLGGFPPASSSIPSPWTIRRLFPNGAQPPFHQGARSIWG